MHGIVVVGETNGMLGVLEKSGKINLPLREMGILSGLKITSGAIDVAAWEISIRCTTPGFGCCFTGVFGVARRCT